MKKTINYIIGTTAVCAVSLIVTGVCSNNPLVAAFGLCLGIASGFGYAMNNELGDPDKA